MIPRGEYGGGDVIVWDWGTWCPTERRRPDGADRERRAALRPDRREARRAGSRSIRTKRRQGGKEQWLLIHKHDDAAVTGWDPEDHPDVGEVGTHQRRGRRRSRVPVARRPAGRRGGGGADDGERSVVRDQSRSGPRRPRGAAKRRRDPSSRKKPAPSDRLVAKPTQLARQARGPRSGGTWTVDGDEVKLTNLDKVLFPADETGRAAVTKRDLIRYYALIAPVILPYLADRPVNVHRFPDGVGEEGLLAEGGPGHAPDWVTQWRYPDAGNGRDGVVRRRRLAGDAGVGGEPGRRRAAPVDVAAATNHDRPTWALVDIDPGPETTFDDVVVLAQLHRTALDHLGVVGLPKVTGQRGIQVWIPVSRSTRSTRRGVGREAVASHRRDRAGPRQLEVGQGRPLRPRPPRLHPERDQQDPGRAVQPASRARCPGVGPAALGRSSTTPTSDPTGGTSTPCSTVWPHTRDPFARLLTIEQDLPKL